MAVGSASRAFILFFLIAVALPILMLIWSSLLPGYEQPSLHALHDLTFANYAPDHEATGPGELGAEQPHHRDRVRDSSSPC